MVALQQNMLHKKTIWFPPLVSPHASVTKTDFCL